MLLFNGLKPNNFYQYQEPRYQLMAKLYFLTGGNAPFASGGVVDGLTVPRPWIEACVVAVQQEGTTHYCLFDTELKSNSESVVIN